MSKINKKDCHTQFTQEEILAMITAVKPCARFFEVNKSASEIGMDITKKNAEKRNLRKDMKKCPHCNSRKHLHIKCDLRTLNTLEYWIRCDKCENEWTEKMLGYKNDTPKDEKEFINKYNKYIKKQKRKAIKKNSGK